MEKFIGAGPEKLPVTPRTVKLLKWVAVLALLAMCAAAYLTYLHFEPAAGGFCNLSSQFNCEIVNKSQWSYIEIGPVEIPVAILGFIYYLGIFIGSLGVIRGWEFTRIHKWLVHHNVINLKRWFTYIGVLFTLYLTYIESFVLHTYCLFCVIQQILILGILGLLIAIKAKKEKKTRLPE